MKKAIAIISALIVLCGLLAFSVSAAGLTEAGKLFEKYDVNDDGSIDISDVTTLLSYLSTECSPQNTGLPETEIFFETYDVNEDGAIDISDVTTLLSHLATECEHIYSEWIAVPAIGCSPVSYNVRFCFNCGIEENDLGVDVPDMHHDPGIPESKHATCTEDGYVICYCRRCGEQIINEVLPKTGHKFGVYEFTAAGHFKRCENRGCYYVTETKAHRYSDGCDTTCNDCSYTRVTEHQWKCSNDDSFHWDECSVCGADGEKTAHSYKNDCVFCDVCQYKSNNSHSWSETYESDGSTHWKVCTTCGEEGTKSSHSYRVDCTACDVCKRSSGAGHNWILEYQKNGTEHWYPCENCTQKHQKEQHAYTQAEPSTQYLASPATCQKAAAYHYHCVCGEKGQTTFSHGAPVDHNWSAYVQEQERHYKTCKYGCGAIKDEAPHSYGAYEEITAATCTTAGKKVRTCTVCQKEDSTEIPILDHKWDLEKYDSDETYHWYKCADCGEAKEKQSHSYDHVCDPDCNVCGKERTVHEYKDYAYNEQNHWRICVHCQTPEAPTQHEFENACDTKCDLCGKIRETEHAWEIKKNTTTHWNECTVCGTAEEKQSHSYDHACDTECNVCYYTRITHHQYGEWTMKNETEHCRICEICDSEEIAAHSGGKATCTEAPVCADCKASYGKAKGHDFSGKPEIDGEEHYLRCLNGCGSEQDRSVHTYGPFTVEKPATCTESGKKVRTCTVCQKEDWIEIPILNHNWDFEKYYSDETHHWYKCADCGEEGDPVAHDNTKPSNIIASKADCENPEYRYYICSICEKQSDLTYAVGEPLGHQKAQQPTKEDEYHYYACLRCEARLEQGAHVGEYTVTKAPSCIAEGEKTRYCSVCGHKDVKTLGSLDHVLSTTPTLKTTVIPGDDMDVYVHTMGFKCTNPQCNYFKERASSVAHMHKSCEPLEGVVPTCTESGLTFGIICAVEGCNEVLLEQEIIAPLGHDYVNGVCSRCGDRKGSIGLSYTLSDDGSYYVVTGIGTCTDTDVVIPSTYNGLPVTSIGNYAFCYCEGLTSITIPDSVTSIGSGAFWGCTGLTSIVIPDSVTSIGDEAFVYCEGLTSIIIPDSVTSIGADAFNGCSGLTSVTIGKSVTSIGRLAFDGCIGLTSITIPDSVTSIGDYAFNGCTGLTSVTIGKSVTSIGDFAFASCTGLTSIVIPDSVTSIGEYAFYNCTGLTSVTIGKSVTSIGKRAFYYCKGLTSITIPDSVTSIGERAFDGCTELTSVTIGKCVTSIGDYAFSGCTELTSINVSLDNPTYYSEGNCIIEKESKVLIAGCKNSIIPNDITSIGNLAFAFCEGLTSITIPDSVTSIGERAFYNCTGLTSITVSPDNPTYYSEGNCIIEKESKALIVGCKNSVIPDSVTSIGDSAFMSCTGLTSIVIPDSVTSIGNMTFAYCTGLTSITIPDSVTSIGNWAFLECDWLNDIWCEAPKQPTEWNADWNFGCSAAVHWGGSWCYVDGVPTLHSWQNATCENPKTCLNCGATEGEALGHNWDGGSCTKCGAKHVSEGLEFTLNDTEDGYIVTGIGTCTDTDIVIPSTYNGLPVVSIGDYAFNGCTGLTNIVIPDSVTSIGCNAFVGCTGLTNIVIPDSVTSIGGEAFRNCSGLTSVTIGKSVTSIGDSAFEGCTGLTSIVIPDSVTSIGNGAFDYCKGLTSITIPDSVTSIGGSAFYNTSYYDTASNWENGVLYIGNHLISAKGNVSGNYTIKAGTLCIANDAFSGCTELTSITIPDSVTSIGECAFYGCTGLTSITILDSVTSIGWSAFRFCTNLTDIWCEAPKQPTEWNAEWNYDCSATVHWGGSWCYVDGVPALHNWKDATCENPRTCLNCGATEGAALGHSWEDGSCTKCGAKHVSEGLEFTLNDSEDGYIVTGIGTCTDTDVVIPSTYNGLPVKAIRDFAFADCTGLTSVVIPDSITSISYGMFDGCTGLTSVDIPDSVTSIEDGAFWGCSRLTSIVIPDSVTSIGGDAFINCTGLTSVTIGKGVTSIGGGAFTGCAGLTNIVIPDRVTSIGGYAFAYCTGLTSITIPDSVTSIENSAFEGCTGLTSIVIPDSVTSIGNAAFSGCSELTDIWCEAESKPAGWNGNWNYSCSATVHWGDSWEYVDGVPTLK